MFEDLKFALRTFRKNPAFASIAVLALALGIGANTAIFSVINAVVLHPVPLPHPEQLVVVNSHTSGDFGPGLVSWPDYLDVRDQTTSFQSLAAYQIGQYTISGPDRPEALEATISSANLFAALGVQPALGRGFAPGEDEPGRNHIVVITDGLWRRRFEGSREVLGRTITLDGEPYTIVGVAPPSLRFPTTLQNGALFLPLPHGSDTKLRESRGLQSFNVIGRLKPGVSVSNAQAELSTVQARLAAAYPQTNAVRTLLATELRQKLVGDQRPTMLMLLGAVAFVLLIACANVSNLLLARATSRQREIAIRAALGADRGRLIRQLLTESILLSLIGGGLGLLLAAWCLDLLTTLFPAGAARMSEIAIDRQVLLFTLGMSGATGLLFGLVPALQAARVDLNLALSGSGRSVSGGHRRARSLLLIGEIALATLLLIGAGLTLRSFSRLSSIDPGFNPHDVLTASLTLPETRYPNEGSILAFYRDLQERFRALPNGATGALAAVLPLSHTNIMLPFSVDDRPPPPENDWPMANVRWISPQYFDVMGIQLLRGRTHTAADDDPNAMPTAVINESIAKKYFANEDPVGKHLTINLQPPDRDVSYEVIGIVKDVYFTSLRTATEPELYVPFSVSQIIKPPADFNMFALARGPHGMPMAAPLRAAVQDVDPSMATAEVKSMDDYLAESLARERLTTLLLTVFGLLALILAVIGIYGVISYTVTQRTREIGIRRALGAQRGAVLRMILLEAARLTLAGLAMGIIGSLATTRVLASQLYGLSATDPRTFVGVAILLATVALLASFIPAWRATRIDPMVALQGE